MAETIIGAVLPSMLGVVFDRLASPQVLEFFRRKKLDEKLCEKLKTMLLSLDPLVAYAELKQSDERVRGWLDAVTEAVLDAEDLLDEIDIQITQSQLEPQSSNSWVRNPFKASPFNSFDRKVESSMKEVLGNLEDLKGQKDDLGLKKVSGAGVASVVKKVESTSHPSESENVMYGRNDDKERIIDWLTSPTTENCNKVSIISIVGMGGLGKTTLAKHVFNDSIVVAEFDVRAWVCVSDDFDVLKLTKAILVAMTKSAQDNMLQELEPIHGRLKEELSRKKFLLVLDDVWNKETDQWEALHTPLNYGARGSKILVTTRIKEVADSCVPSGKIHYLKKLQEEHCWEVFVRHAFNNKKDHHLKQEFEKIGRQIVEKCKGLPLALKTIGNLLNRKSSVSDWESVLKSEMWQFQKEHDKIIPALLLSYYHLPSYLKRCFGFCALFPKDFMFVKEDLIMLWMAENFLQCSQQNKSMVKVGEEYFDDLLSWSFFEKCENTEFYVMHDLLNDLANYVCGNICFRWDNEMGKSTVVKKTRHISFPSTYVPSEMFKNFHEASRLRTFLPLNWNRRMVYDKHGLCMINMKDPRICDLLSKCRFLRVLSVCNNWQLREVPDFVGNLKHLRSLDLSGTRIKKLPNSTCSLFNLHILKLQSCESLKELPPDLHKLRKLHHLNLRGTELRKFPMHLGQLKNLQVLMDSFCVGKGGEFKIQQLGELNIRGELRISDMQNIVNPSHALAANFKSKMHLVRLELEWSGNHDDSKQEKEVLEKLQPSKHLEELRILDYGGTKFPRWFGDDSLFSVVSLELIKCENCMSLPSIGQLPSLKKLSIIGLGGIVAIGEEFYGSPSSSFASLETLVFKQMKEWKKWECKAVTGAFPKLRELSIENCPELEEPLPEQLPCLEKLTIDGCKELGKIGQKIEECGRMETLRSDGECMEVSSVDYYFPNPIHHYYNSLVDLSVGNCCESPTTFPLDFFPNLRFIFLRECYNLQMISQDQPHNHLRKLGILCCPQFESFPNEGLCAPKLETFLIFGLKNLKSLPKQMDTLLPSLTKLSIDNCPEVESISDEHLPSKLKDLELSRCSKLMASLKGALGANTSIERMEIYGMDMESFPDEGFLPPSLTSLGIGECQDLKRLDYRAPLLLI